MIEDLVKIKLLLTQLETVQRVIQLKLKPLELLVQIFFNYVITYTH